GHVPGRASAHEGSCSRQDLIPSTLGTNLWGLRVSSTGDVKHDGEGGPAKKRPLRHLSRPGALLSNRPSTGAEPRWPSSRLGGGPGGLPPDASLPPRPSKRGAALGRDYHAHRADGYPATPIDLIHRACAHIRPRSPLGPRLSCTRFIMPRTISALTAAEYQALVNGIPKYCPKAIYSFAGQTYTAVQAVKVISTVLNAVSATANAKTALTDARQAE